jgi:flagellar protein FliO/FliZ
MVHMLFGEGSYALKMLFAFIAVFGILALALWLVKRFGGERLGNTSARGRQPRLAVIDHASVDGRRKLVLIRRDNVEHLLIIGGPTDVVVEPNIVRAAGPAREAPPARPSGDTLPRAVPLSDNTMWPLQPEPAARIEPGLRPEPPTRQTRASVPTTEERPEWSERDAALAPPSPPREGRMRPDALSAFPDELSRTPATSESTRASSPPRPTLRRESRARPSVASGAALPEPKLSSPADQNLADMAQRLEAALRRPPTTEDGRAENEKPEPAETQSNSQLPDLQAHRPAPSEAAKPARPEPRGPRNEAKPGAPGSLYDSLEQEMASLLGRPGKS